MKLQMDTTDSRQELLLDSSPPPSPSSLTMTKQPKLLPSSDSDVIMEKITVCQQQEEDDPGQHCLKGNNATHHKALDIKSEFNLIRTLAKSAFGKVILGKKDGEKMVLKVFHTKQTSWDEFQRELNYNYFLSPHPNIVTSYNVSFDWKSSYIFVQEYAPLGDLSHFITSKHFNPSSLGSVVAEPQVKGVVQQIASALDFMHGIHLVHGDVLLENILVFKQDLSLVKLCDFGSTQPENMLMVRRVSAGHVTENTFPPEICDIIPQEKYYSSTSSDVWQLGICILELMNGVSPWAVADITDSGYSQYIDWLKRKSLRMPESLKSFTPRLIRLVKRMLEPKPSKRCQVREVFKYMKDGWVEKQCFGSACRKCPSNSSVNTTRSTGGRKESSASTISAENANIHIKRRSISPASASACISMNNEANGSTSSVPILASKLILGPPIQNARHARAKSLKGGEGCRRSHTFRDISPATAATTTTPSKPRRNGYAMRRCTSYEISTSTAAAAGTSSPLTKTKSILRKNSGRNSIIVSSSSSQHEY